MAAPALGALLTAVTAASGAAAAEGTGPRVLSAKLDPPAVVGRPAELRLTAAAGSEPVSGVAVRFGLEQSFGLSACLADSSGIPQPPFAGGSTVRFSVPHTFRRPGPRAVLVRLDVGSCASPGPSAFQPMIVKATQPGEPTAPPTLLPMPLPGPAVPGADDLPPAGLVPAALLSRRRPRCPGAGRRIGRSAASLRAARRAVLCLINVHRRRSGLRRLRSNARLRRAATGHSRAMVRRRFFGHVAPAGPSLLARVRRTHYLAGARGWTIAENIGFGRWPHATPGGMVRSWMRSSGHRANILRPTFRSVGVGIARGIPGRPRARGATYTTDFATRRR